MFLVGGATREAGREVHVGVVRWARWTGPGASASLLPSAAQDRERALGHAHHAVVSFPLDECLERRDGARVSQRTESLSRHDADERVAVAERADERLDRVALADVL